MKFPINSHRITHQIPSNIELTTSPFSRSFPQKKHTRLKTPLVPPRFSQATAEFCSLVDRLCNIQAAGTWEGTGAVESTKNWGLPEGTMGTRPGKHTKNYGKSQLFNR